jgi:hypothetical protein
VVAEAVICRAAVAAEVEAFTAAAVAVVVLTEVAEAAVCVAAAR